MSRALPLLSVLVLLSASTVGTQGRTADATVAPFGVVTLPVEFQVDGEGRNIDSIAFWEAPDPTQSLMFVTAKGLPLVEVWKYPFAGPADQLPPLRHSCITSGTNGVSIDQDTDRLYVSVRTSPDNCVFSLPDQAFRFGFTSGGVVYGGEPNSALLRVSDGSTRVYVSDNTVTYVHDAVDGALLGSFAPATGLETMWGDDHYQVLYIPDEGGRSGVYAHHPDGRPYSRNGLAKFGDRTVFDSDAEGIVTFRCLVDGADTGQGLIVVSDQILADAGGNDYEMFDRATWAHLGKFKLTLPSGALVSNTDGIGTTQQSTPAHPGGLFTAVQDDASVVGVGWDRIFAAIAAQTGRPAGCAAQDGAPTVIATTPVGDATDVDVTADVTATFSEPVQGVDAASFRLTDPSGRVVEATVSPGTGNQWVLDPGGTLVPGAAYTATLTGGPTAIRDLAEQPLSTVTWTFTTAAAPSDTTAPTVTQRAPVPDARAVALGTNVTAAFDEPVQGVTAGTFALVDAATGRSVAVAVSYSDTARSATANPSSNLAADTRYRATLTTGIQDTAGNALPQDVSWEFLTGPAPRVSGRSPGIDATGVSRTANVTVTFNEQVQHVSTTTFTLTPAGGGTPVAARVARNGTTNQWILDPAASLASRTKYTATIGAVPGVADLAGNPLAGSVAWGFTTR